MIDGIADGVWSSTYYIQKIPGDSTWELDGIRCYIFHIQ